MQALEKSECDRASLEKQLRELQGVGIPRAAASAPGERDLAAPMGSLPVFNTRTDDIGVVALAALGCLIMSGGIMYLQRSLGGGGVGGAFVVMCGLVGFVLSVVVLFKSFLYLFGANSDEVLKVGLTLDFGACLLGSDLFLLIIRARDADKLRIALLNVLESVPSLSLSNADAVV